MKSITSGFTILAIIDSISLTLAFSISIFIRQSIWITRLFGQTKYDTALYLISFIIATFLLLTIFSSFKLYQIRNIELSTRVFTVLKALLIWTLIITMCVYAIKFDFSRFILFMTVVITAIFICLGRFAYFRYRRNRTRDIDIDVHIIGTGERAKHIEKQLKDNFPSLSVICLDPNDHSILQFLASLKSDDIFIADERLSREQVMEILANEKLGHHSFRVILDTFRLVTGEVRLTDIDDIPSIVPGQQPNHIYVITKRLIDIVTSGLGMIFIFPLWLLISCAIKLDSRGPILIKQSRIGSDCRPFTMFKFRTMRCDASLYEYAPYDGDDSRITRIGKILRRLSMDELPQLWNILKGDMSLVGPRPEMEFIVKEYEPWQNTRLKAKPGLTGLWQILGRKDIPLHENLEYDFYYVCNRNLTLDTIIMLKTIPAVLFGRGAY